jgi:hypothetical protein
MKANSLRIGQGYECVFDGDQGREKCCMVPLAVDVSKRHQFVLVEARLVRAKASEFFSRVLAMSYQEIVEEDLDGGPDREWSSCVWRMEITEAGELYYPDYDLYIDDLVEVDLDAPEPPSRPKR